MVSSTSIVPTDSSTIRLSLVTEQNTSATERKKGANSHKELQDIGNIQYNLKRYVQIGKTS